MITIEVVELRAKFATTMAALIPVPQVQEQAKSEPSSLQQDMCIVRFARQRSSCLAAVLLKNKSKLQIRSLCRASF